MSRSNVIKRLCVGKSPTPCQALVGLDASATFRLSGPCPPTPTWDSTATRIFPAWGPPIWSLITGSAAQGDPLKTNKRQRFDDRAGQGQFVNVSPKNTGFNFLTPGMLRTFEEPPQKKIVATGGGMPDDAFAEVLGGEVGMHSQENLLRILHPRIFSRHNALLADKKVNTALNVKHNSTPNNTTLNAIPQQSHSNVTSQNDHSENQKIVKLFRWGDSWVSAKSSKVPFSVGTGCETTSQSFRKTWLPSPEEWPTPEITRSTSPKVAGAAAPEPEDQRCEVPKMGWSLIRSPDSDREGGRPSYRSPIRWRRYGPPPR